MGASGYSPGVAYVFGDFELDVSALELRERGILIAVQPKVLEVLTYLVRNRDRVVPPKELLGAVWPGISVGPNSVQQAIAAVRRTLKDESDATPIIRTQYAKGYRFVAPVEHRAESASGPASDRLPFVGRGDVLTRCARSIDRARSGKGDIVLLT